MSLLLDTSAIVVLANARDPDHEAVRRVRRDERGLLIIPAPVTAEAEYMLMSRLGSYAADQFLQDLAAGVFHVECLTPAEYALVIQTNARYADLRLGLADLSIIVLARRFNTRRILTFDHRHFRAVEALQGGRFTLLPDDA